MTKDEIKSLVFVCPYHGRVDPLHVTPLKTCGRCVEDTRPDAVVGGATKLRRKPYKGHHPRWKYDCERCKFAWCCGPQCACHLEGKMPKKRREEVDHAAIMFLERRKRR